MPAIQVFWVAVVVLEVYMTLENEVAALVTSTTALQNTVAAEMAKVRSENAEFKATVVPSTGSSAIQGTLTASSLVSIADMDINGLNVGRGFSNHNSNTVIGFEAGAKFSLGTGVGLTAVGRNALGGNNSGNWNTAIGRETLSSNTTASNLTAVGNSALVTNTTGSDNTGLGFHSLFYNETGLANTGVGSHSLFSNTTGNFNSALGQGSIAANTTGSFNTGIGHSSLNVNTDYSNCTGLGVDSQVSGNNQVQLGNAATTTFSYGPVQNRSDIRDKADIRPTVLGLDFIKALRPKDFRWDMRDAYRTPIPEAPLPTASNEEKQAYVTRLTDWQNQNKFTNIAHDGSKKKKRYHHGLIAQDVEELIRTTGQDFGGFQDHKRSGGDDVLSIGYDELIAPLIKAVQELAQVNEELRGRITALEARK